MIERLIPKYEKLVDFTVAMAPRNVPVTKWDNRKLDEYSGKVSQYLHWSGGWMSLFRPLIGSTKGFSLLVRPLITSGTV